MLRKFFYPLLLLLLLLPAVLPLFKPYVSGTADGLGHRFRLVSFYNSLKEGNIRPRWAGDAAAGFGAPTFLFNYPLPYYIASFFHFLGFSINISGQLLSATSLFLSGLFMFLVVRKMAGGWEKSGQSGRLGGVGEMAGLVAAIVYTYAPYHLQMTYLYDSWGEEVAFVFPPLILSLIGLIGQIGKLKIRYFILLVLAWVLFILSHNVSAMMFSPVLLFIAMICIRQSLPNYSSSDPDLASGESRSFISSSRQARTIKPILLILNAFILAVIISAFFWLPAISLQNEMKYPQFLAQESVMRGSFFKSFSFQWETAFRVIKEGITHYLDFTVGLPIILIGLIGLIRLIGNMKKFTVLLLFSLYLTTYHSNWIWSLPIVSFPFSFILYPFRFLFVASFVGALLAGAIVWVIREKWVRGVIGGAIITLAIIQGLPYTRPYIDIFPFPESYFSQRQTVTSAPGTRKNMLIKEFLPGRASLSFLEKEEKDESAEIFEIIDGKGKTENIKSTSEKLEAKLDLESDATVTINKFYFPNWQVEIDGQEKEVTSDKEGRMTLKVDKGKHHLELAFGVSGMEKIAYLVSLVGIIILMGEVFIIHHFSARAKI